MKWNDEYCEIVSKGVRWSCSKEDSGWLVAISDTTPHSELRAKTWDKLIEDIRAFDPIDVRRDAVAVADPVPGVGSTVFGQEKS